MEAGTEPGTAIPAAQKSAGFASNIPQAGGNPIDPAILAYSVTSGQSLTRFLPHPLTLPQFVEARLLPGIQGPTVHPYAQKVPKNSALLSA